MEISKFWIHIKSGRVERTNVLSPLHDFKLIDAKFPEPKNVLTNARFSECNDFLKTNLEVFAQ